MFRNQTVGPAVPVGPVLKPQLIDGADDARWFVISVNKSQERTATNHLREAGHVTYCPLRVVVSRKAGAVARPFFPGYVFANVGADAQWREIFLTPGVKAVVGGGERPRPLPAGVVREIKSRERNGFLELVEPDKRECPHREGDRVKVELGPHGAVVEAIFLGRVDDERCSLLVSLLGTDSRQVAKLSRVF